MSFLKPEFLADIVVEAYKRIAKCEVAAILSRRSRFIGSKAYDRKNFIEVETKGLCSRKDF